MWWTSVEVLCITKPFGLLLNRMTPLEVLCVGQIFPMSHFTVAKKLSLTHKDGSAIWRQSCALLFPLKLISDQLLYYTTSAALKNGAKAPSTFILHSVKLVSITLGQKWELQYLNRPWPFTCKLNSAPLAETNYSQLLVAGHEWASNVVCIYSGLGSSWNRETETGENLCDSAECDSLFFFFFILSLPCSHTVTNGAWLTKHLSPRTHWGVIRAMGGYGIFSSPLTINGGKGDRAFTQTSDIWQFCPVEGVE